ncbi:ATP-binding protein [ANME-1 cluster archaeon GoMg4]|nr:ATP-binding protein [ANME-1 cluster archaeon GoMg4]
MREKVGNEMKRIEFHDRNRELNEIKNILEREPSLISFIYGPINSGKTELMSYAVKQLPAEDYAIFRINLRGRFIRGYEEFLDVLFDVDEERKEGNAKEYAKAILKDLKLIGGIPIPLNLFERMLERKERSKDVFKYIESLLEEISQKYVPVLIIDELQVIKPLQGLRSRGAEPHRDVKIDELLIYKLFNFFIRLTKELHLCHVFAVSSDSLFIEEIYSEAMLQGRCDYLQVDDFSYEETRSFLEKYGFSEDVREKVWDYCGGKPVYLVKVINAKMSGKNIKEELEDMLETRKSQILSIFDDIALKRVDVSEDAIIKEFSVFEVEEKVRYERLNDAKVFLVKRNVLFVDPTRRTIRPQSKLDLLAMREVVKEA